MQHELQFSVRKPVWSYIGELLSGVSRPCCNNATVAGAHTTTTAMNTLEKQSLKGFIRETRASRGIRIHGSITEMKVYEDLTKQRVRKAEEEQFRWSMDALVQCCVPKSSLSKGLGKHAQSENPINRLSQKLCCMIQSSLENTNHIFCVYPNILFDRYQPLPAANARAKPQTSVSKQDRQWRSTENYGLSQKVCSTVQSSLRKCIDRIRLFCVSPDIPVDRCYPLQLSCDALATGSVKVTRYG